MREEKKRLELLLIREKEQNDIKGTAGSLYIKYPLDWEMISKTCSLIKNKICRTLELDWQNNNRNVSCIPEGVYKIRQRKVGKYFNAYKKRWGHEYSIEIEGVEGRSAILIHTGNSTKDTRGCVLVGNESYIVGGQWRIGASRNAYSFLYNILDDYKDCEIVIEIKTAKPLAENEAEYNSMERNDGGKL